MPKMKKVLITFLLTISISVGLIAQEDWELLNPIPSYLYSNDIEFTSSQRGIIVNDDELIVTEDGGNTWLKQQDIFSGNDIDSYDESVFIVGDNGYWLFSGDSGENWFELDPLTNEDYNTVQFLDIDTIFLATENQVIRTYNGGAAWESIAVDGGDINKMWFVNSLVGHLVCDDGVILKTIDGGNSWYETLDTPFTPSDFFSVYFINEQIGYACKEHNDTYRTIDGGESWEEVGGLSDAIYTFWFKDEMVGYAGGENGALFKTEDGGENWEWKSFIPLRSAYADINASFFFDENNGFITGADGRIAKTSDGGESWESYAPSYRNVEELRFLTPSVGYALIWHTIYKTIDGGITWINMGQTQEDKETNKIAFTSENIGFAIGGGDINSSFESKEVVKTVNGGVSWTVTNGGNPILTDFQGRLKSIEFVNNSLGFVSGGWYQNEGVYRTTNGGNSWVQVFDKEFIEMIFLNSSVGYGINSDALDGEVYKTIDGGQNWELILETDDNINQLYFLDENTGYLVGGSSLMKQTTNGGEMWVDVEVPYGSYVEVAFFSQSEGYIVNDYGEIYQTTDSTSTWEELDRVYGIKDLKLVDNKVYIAGDRGRILRSNFLLTNIKELVASKFEVSLYPNPTSDIAKIEVEETQQISTVDVYSLKGKHFYRKQNPDLGNQINIDFSSLPTGAYYVVVSLVGGDIVSDKILVVH